MTQALMIHPDNPQGRLIDIAVEHLQQGGIIIYPTDSCYALGCRIGDKRAMERIRQIRQLDKKHLFTLMCRDLSEISLYAKVSNAVFRFLKSHTPGPFTFVLPATPELPRRLQNPKRKTVGIRVPDCNITQAILAALGEPMITSSLIPPGEEFALADINEIYDRFQGLVDIIIEGGIVETDKTTVIDLTGDVLNIVREGRGELDQEYA